MPIDDDDVFMCVHVWFITNTVHRISKLNCKFCDTDGKLNAMDEREKNRTQTA